GAGGVATGVRTAATETPDASGTTPPLERSTDAKVSGPSHPPDATRSWVALSQPTARCGSLESGKTRTTSPFRIWAIAIESAHVVSVVQAALPFPSPGRISTMVRPSGAAHTTGAF